MPGQKLWLWALSREGGVWEELLTDTDGQYVEFQAGRLFVQYSPGASVNPITQASFDPLSASRWTERWFPLEGTGGLSDASREGALHATVEGSQLNRLNIGVNAFREIQDTLKVWSGTRLVVERPVTLNVLEPFETTVDITAGDSYRVELPGLGLDYDSDPAGRLLDRPFSTDPEAFPSIPESDRAVFQARELLKGRRYAGARELFEDVLENEPWNREALLGLAELAYRSGSYGLALDRVNRARQLDAYDAKANFLAGTIYRALRRTADARTADAQDAFGWAARSTTYRSAAYAQLAEVMIGEEEFLEAAWYARLAIDFDRYSVVGWRALAVIGRKSEDEGMAEDALGELLALDPLHHFVWAEKYLAAPVAAAEVAAAALDQRLGGEFPHQTLLELAIGYEKLGLREDALKLLTVARESGPQPLVHRAWLAWLMGDPSLLAGATDPDFAFPYRRESLRVLEWTVANSDDWVWRYLLALNLWAVDRQEEAADNLDVLAREPDFGPLYVARAHLLSQTRGEDPGPDLRRAVPWSWRRRTGASTSISSGTIRTRVSGTPLWPPFPSPGTASPTISTWTSSRPGP
jgi:tetratricopeptide (TPR) repeat protein